MPTLAATKHLVTRLAYSGLNDSDDIEIKRRVFLVNLFSVVGFLYLVVFGVGSLLAQRTTLATFVLGSAAITAVNFFYLRWTGNHRIAGHVVVTVVVTIFIYFICSGGVDNTGPLWCYCLAPYILFLYGTRKGLLLITGLIAFSAVVLLVPDMPLLHAQYAPNFKVRFLASFVAAVIMAAVHEFARERTQRRMLELYAMTSREARTDPLTGLSNRRHMYEHIERVRAAQHTRPQRLTLLLCDIDDFKTINDNHGHACGDQVLKQIAGVFRQTLRQDDAVARWGGEEFLVFLPGIDAARACERAEHIRQSVAELALVCGQVPVPVTMSIGVHLFDTALSVDRNIAQADRNLYRAKSQGRNRVASDAS
jgi:diguanylate cyclase (GGDEF)-like protein